MKITVQESIRWKMMSYGISQQEALELLIGYAFESGHKFYSGDGHPIPKSSYLPYKGAPVDTQS
jgi:hypothetical protein